MPPRSYKLSQLAAVRPRGLRYGHTPNGLAALVAVVAAATALHPWDNWAGPHRRFLRHPACGPYSMRFAELTRLQFSLYGIMCMQTLLYFRAYSRDKFILKAAVRLFIILLVRTNK